MGLDRDVSEIYSAKSSEDEYIMDAACLGKKELLHLCLPARALFVWSHFVKVDEGESQRWLMASETSPKQNQKW